MTYDSSDRTEDQPYPAGVLLLAGNGNYYAIPNADLARFRVPDEERAQLAQAISDNDTGGYLEIASGPRPSIHFSGLIWAVIPMTALVGSQPPLIDHHGGNPER